MGRISLAKPVKQEPTEFDYMSQLFDWLVLCAEKAFVGQNKKPPHDRQKYNDYLKSKKWSRKRRVALQRAKNRCQICNSPRKLQVHHRTYVRLYRELPQDLTVLCDQCHAIFHANGRLAG